MSHEQLVRASLASLAINVVVCASSLLGAAATQAGIVPPMGGLPFWITALGVGNCLTAFAAALFDSLAHRGARATAPVLALSIAVGLTMEILGTTVGLPFGRYEYSEFLGPKLLGRVPLVLPLAWFSLIHPSLTWAAALRLPRWATVVAGAYILLLADVPMDPAMTAGFSCWTWRAPGAYYGMPLTNWLGWFVTGCLVAVLVPRAPPERGGRGWHWLLLPSLIYLVQCGFMAGLAAAYGRPGAALAWLVGLVPVGLLGLRARAR